MAQLKVCEVLSDFGKKKKKEKEKGKRHLVFCFVFHMSLGVQGLSVCAQTQWLTFPLQCKPSANNKD